MTLKTRRMMAPVRPGYNCYEGVNKKKFLVIHQTGNINKGANASMHAILQAGGYGASWHWQVDDVEAVQSFEHSVQCWHASDGRGDGNLNSIAIEICINRDGNYLKSVQNGAKLAAKILKDENIPLENMKQHYDFARDKKNCPAQIRAGKEGVNWGTFVQMVQGELDVLNNVAVVLGAKTHKVQVGDTLWAIGRKYKVSVEDIKKWNKLTSALIFPGQVLNVTGEVKKEQPKPKPQPKPQPKPKKEYVKLSAKVSSWRIYPLGVQPVANNEKGFLNPKQFNGLEYEVLGYEDNKKCAIIQTQDFGKGKIYLDSDATIVWK